MEGKIFHPTILNSTVKEIDPELLDLAANLLHALGWFTQQGGIEAGLDHIRWLHNTLPDAFLKICSNGLTVILDALSESESEPLSGTSHILPN